jgi:hypothetical protein
VYGVVKIMDRTRMFRRTLELKNRNKEFWEELIATFL